MTTTGTNLFYELFPKSNTRNQAYWEKHFDILRNQGRVSAHLSTLAAITEERLHFFKKQADRNNGLLLVVICTTSWLFVRDLAHIDSEDLKWLRAKHPSDPDEIFYDIWADLVQFMRNMGILYNIHSYLRHPFSPKFKKKYLWIFQSEWPEDKTRMIIETASDLHSFLNLISHEFSVGSGWVDDCIEKQALHDKASLQCAS